MLWKWLRRRVGAWSPDILGLLGKSGENQAFKTLTPSSPGPGDFLREPKVYEDLTDLTVLKTAMETALNEYNLSPAVVPMQLVLFREAIEHSEHLLPSPLPFPSITIMEYFQGNRDPFPNLSQISPQSSPGSYLPPCPRCPNDSGWDF